MKPTRYEALRQAVDGADSRLSSASSPPEQSSGVEETFDISPDQWDSIDQRVEDIRSR